MRAKGGNDKIHLFVKLNFGVELVASVHIMEEVHVDYMVQGRSGSSSTGPSPVPSKHHSILSGPHSGRKIRSASLATLNSGHWGPQCCRTAGRQNNFQWLHSSHYIT